MNQNARKRKSRGRKATVEGPLDPATYTVSGAYRKIEIGDMFTLRDDFVSRAHQDAGGVHCVFVTTEYSRCVHASLLLNPPYLLCS